MKIEEIINLHDISPRKLAAKNLATKRIKRKKEAEDLEQKRADPADML